LPERSSVKLEVYDLLGRVVTTLVDGEQEARFYEVSWRRMCPSGIYFYRIVATAVNDLSKSFVQVRKIILVK